ncbi:MAG: sigma-70 family RNA polymerase sigma factor [Verrucomicrobiales bacterium]|nr:sigma-70 family RNA polymerase sigma factor [Verrucomicrobiales bacterium]
MPEQDKVETFTRLLIANRGRLFGFIFTMVHDRTATEEILQEASTVLWKKFDQFEPGTDFGAWAMKISRYSVFEWRRRQAKLPLPMDDELLESLSEKALEISCESEAQLEALDSCLKKLNSRDRDLIRSRYDTEDSVAEIAKAGGKSRVAVYKVLNRIHRDLLSCMENESKEEFA